MEIRYLHWPVAVARAAGRRIRERRVDRDVDAIDDRSHLLLKAVQAVAESAVSLWCH